MRCSINDVNSELDIYKIVNFNIFVDKMLFTILQTQLGTFSSFSLKGTLYWLQLRDKLLYQAILDKLVRLFL